MICFKDQNKLFIFIEEKKVFSIYKIIIFVNNQKNQTGQAPMIIDPPPLRLHQQAKSTHSEKAPYLWNQKCNFDAQKNCNMVYTVPPVSCHWSCQSSQSTLRARIIGDVQAGIMPRPVNSMNPARKKDSPRCSVKLPCREFIKTVPNIPQKISSSQPSPLKSLFRCS